MAVEGAVGVLVEAPRAERAWLRKDCAVRLVPSSVLPGTLALDCELTS